MRRFEERLDTSDGARQVSVSWSQHRRRTRALLQIIHCCIGKENMEHIHVSG